MKLARTFSKLGLVALVAALAGGVTTVAACGGTQTKTAKIKAGDMPEGESWTGVYFHPVYGHLHIEEQETSIRGKWKRADQSAWGELSGTKTGNVLHFTWKEWKSGVVGGVMNGKGYFVYEKTPEMEQAKLNGEYGVGADETGSEWNCVKQARMMPDLKSIGGDTGGSAPTSGALD